MTTLLAAFLLALLLSLVLTPIAGRLGMAMGAVDLPEKRKVHDRPMPRTGGLAVFVSLVLSLAALMLMPVGLSRVLAPEPGLPALIGGALIALGLGLWDDIRRINAWRKLPVQILAASVAYLGGIALDKFALFGLVVFFDPVTSYLLTVFWFLLFMNALNLMDGLDGLAGGIVFFASLVMVVLALPREDYLTALFFAALAGSVLGFLRSNFHPASIFLGDAGTYFLGYALAGFGLIASVKSQVGAALLIPVLAMGLPLLDTLLAALRRHVQGRNIFQPDSDHIHHRLLRMGLHTRKAVLALYGLTAALCVLAIVLVNIRDEESGLLLVLIGAAAFIFAGRLGYLKTLGLRCFPEQDRVPGEQPRMDDILSELENAPDMDALRERLEVVLSRLGVERGGFRTMHAAGTPDEPVEGRSGPAESRDPFLLRLEIPILSADAACLGTLFLVKDIQSEAAGENIMVGVFALRRALAQALTRLAAETQRTR